jgi:hypothetical protein
MSLAAPQIQTYLRLPLFGSGHSIPLPMPRNLPILTLVLLAGLATSAPAQVTPQNAIVPGADTAAPPGRARARHRHPASRSDPYLLRRFLRGAQRSSLCQPRSRALGWAAHDLSDPLRPLGRRGDTWNLGARDARVQREYFLFLTFNTNTLFPEQWRDWRPRDQPNDGGRERARLFEIEDTGETLRISRDFPG